MIRLIDEDDDDD